MALNATPCLNLVDSDNDIQIRTDNILLLNENYVKKDDDILVVKGNTMAGIPKDSTNKITTLKIDKDNNTKYLKAVGEGENITATWADVEATSIGTLSTLTVEDININNNIISSLNNKDLRLVPYTDKEISLEGDIKLIYNNELRFYNEDTTKYIGFKAPSSIESNKIWILPNSDGSSDEVLKTDGSGNLTWGKAGLDGDVTLTGTQTLSNKTLTSPKIVDGDFIADGNGNEILVFNSTSSAVNTLEISNSNTGNDVSISAIGTDDNIGINLITKGSGTINIVDNKIKYGSTIISSSAAELNYLDDSSPGAIVNSKAVIYGSSGEVNATTLQIGGGAINSSVNQLNILSGTGASENEYLKWNGSNPIWATVSGGGGGGGGSMTSFILEDHDGTEVTIDDGKEIKFIGSGITTNWTDTSNGTDADPYDLTFTVNAAQTGITSIMATDLKIGEDNETKIDFETENEIHFYANNQQQVNITDGAIIPQTTNDISLGSSSNKFKEAYVEGKIIYGHHEFTDIDTNITLSKNIAYFNISGIDTATTIDVSINVGTEGQLSHIFFDTAGTNVKLDFTENNLYVGTGLAQYLTFSISGQAATIVYIGSKWRVINTGATTS